MRPIRQRESAERWLVPDRAGMAGLIIAPGALTLFFAFNDGGFFPGSQALGTVLLLVALAARISFARRPFAGLNGWVGVAAGALGLYAIWVLASGAWSGSTSRALLEFDRALLYLAALVLYGTVPRSSSRVARTLWMVALAFAVVAGAALLTRLLPETFPTSPNLQNDRLSYPLTYWNALGLLAALGAVLCLHLACRARDPVPVRVLGAAAVPMLATTVLFTFSRGAIVAGAIGVVVYLLVARPRGLVGGLVATAPLAVVAVRSGYAADALATTNPTTPTAVAQGKDVFRTVALCMGGSALLRLALVPLDRRIARFRVPEPARRRVLRPLAGAAALAVVLVAVVAGAPGFLDRQYDRFARGDQAQFRADFRKRLADPASPARQRQWRVAVREFHGAELAGTGAGTYQIAWDRERPDPSTVVDAHSLYIELLGELGLVGLVLLAVSVLAILSVFAFRARGRRRALYGALLAAGLAWALHAGVDWDWEMPAVTFWFFALGGAALAASERERTRFGRVAPSVRLVTGLGVLALAAVPAVVGASQRHIDASSAAFARQDCGTAASEARKAVSTLSLRPEPYELLAYCEIRAGRPRQAVADARKAVDRDPHNWSYRYSLAVALGAAGEDPRPEARRARAMNPLEPLTQDLTRRFDTPRRRAWVSRARDVAVSLVSL
jgi:O-antigen ligase